MTLAAQFTEVVDEVVCVILAATDSCDDMSKRSNRLSDQLQCSVAELVAQHLRRVASAAADEALARHDFFAAANAAAACEQRQARAGAVREARRAIPYAGARP